MKGGIREQNEIPFTLMQRHFLLSLIVILLASCGGTTVVTPQGGTTSSGPAADLEATESSTDTDVGPPTSTLSTVTDQARH